MLRDHSLLTRKPGHRYQLEGWVSWIEWSDPKTLTMDIHWQNMTETNDEFQASSRRKTYISWDYEKLMWTVIMILSMAPFHQHFLCGRQSYEHDVIYFSQPCNECRYYYPHFADKERGIKKNIQYDHDSNPSLSDSKGSQLLLGFDVW